MDRQRQGRPIRFHLLHLCHRVGCRVRCTRSSLAVVTDFLSHPRNFKLTVTIVGTRKVARTGFGKASIVVALRWCHMAVSTLRNFIATSLATSAAPRRRPSPPPGSSLLLQQQQQQDVRGCEVAMEVMRQASGSLCVMGATAGPVQGGGDAEMLRRIEAER